MTPTAKHTFFTGWLFVFGHQHDCISSPLPGDFGNG